MIRVRHDQNEDTFEGEKPCEPMRLRLPQGAQGDWQQKQREKHKPQELGQPIHLVLLTGLRAYSAKAG